jgi:pimeloyl-ACP methyl ester carboxylesterase
LIVFSLTSFFAFNSYAAPPQANGKSWLTVATTQMAWPITSMNKVKDNDLYHFVWEVSRPPQGPMDKIALHRVVAENNANPGADHGKVIFVLPGTWSAAGWSDITDPRYNTLLFLANNGYDVFTIDFRNNFIPDMGYDQFAQQGVDISVSGGWGYDVYREDIKTCVEKIKDITKESKIFMAGFSRGAIHMFIYASKYADDLKGLVSFDGGIKDFPPYGQQMDEQTYNMVIAMFKAGQLPNPYNPGEMMPLVYDWDTPNADSWKLAGILPYAKHLAGGPLPTGFDVLADFIADEAYHLWDFMGLGEGILTKYHDGMIMRDILVKSLSEFTFYYPSLQTLESAMLDAYDDCPFLDYDDNDVYLPALAFATTLTCPNGVCLIDAIPNLTKSDDVEIVFLDGYGHMDVMFGTNSLKDVKEPTLLWLNDHLQ